MKRLRSGSAPAWLRAAGVLALVGGVAAALTSTGTLPTVAWFEAHPLTAFGVMVGTGLLDGINPCAIATLLLFIGALLAGAVATSRPDGTVDRRRMWRVAGAYVLGMFLLYLALGLGFLQVATIEAFGNAHLFTRIAGLLAVVLGTVMLAEAMVPGMPTLLAMPSSLHGLARRWGRRTSVGAAFVGGVLIGLCTIPCGGAMYLAIAGLLAGLSSDGLRYALLVTYDAAFVAPLVAIVGIVASRPTAQRLGRLHVRHRATLKAVLGAAVILIGLFALA